MSIHVVLQFYFLGNSDVGEEGALFLLPPTPNHCPTFDIYSISEGLSDGVKFRI